MNLPGRQQLIFGALAATLAAAAWVSLQDSPRPVPGMAAGQRPAPGAAAAPLVDLRLSPRLAAAGAVTDPFAAASLAAGSVPRAGAKQPKPVAPPLPFIFLGKYVEGDSVRVFLDDGEALHMVKVGDIIDMNYRVDRIDNAVRITYLPLNEAQILPIGDIE